MERASCPRCSRPATWSAGGPERPDDGVDGEPLGAVDLDGTPVLLGALHVEPGQRRADLLDGVQDGGALWAAHSVAEVGAVVADEQQGSSRRQGGSGRGEFR